MGKRIRSYNRFVGLHHHTRRLTHETAGFGDLFSADSRIRSITILPRPQSHRNFFERGISRALANKDHRTFHLSGPFEHRRQAVRDRKTEIIMTMHRNDGLRAVGDTLPDAANQRAEFLWNRVADRVGNVHRPRSCRNDRFNDFVEIGRIGPTGIHRRKFHVFDIRLGQLNHFYSPFFCLLTRHSELVLQMDIRGGKERMDPHFPRSLQRFPSTNNILLPRPRQTTHGGPFDL